MNYLRNLTRSFQAQLRCSQRLFATTPAINSDEKKIIVPKRPFNTSVKRSDGNGLEKQIEVQKAINKENSDMTELLRDFLDPAEFFGSCEKIANIGFYCGVPDSLLKDFCAYVSSNTNKENHVITANEGSAIAMAAGYHLATNKNSMVYLQNSGLGNIVNPLMSLCSTSVYSIPMLLLVGWRGEPGKRDEPQHLTQGSSTPALLASLGIPFQTLPDYQEGAEQALATAKHHMDTVKGPYCLLVKRQTFLPYKMKPLKFKSSLMNREQCLNEVVDSLGERDVVVSTTGMLSRELFELRENRGQGHEKDFLTVGSMGHTSAIAMGISKFKQNRQVICLDGDGSVIMHMGSMASIGQNAPENFKHVIFNNGSHDSVGGQPSDALGDNFSFGKIALGCGYKHALVAETKEEIKEGIEKIKTMKGPVLLEVKCCSGHRKNLGRPTRSPIENKSDFMHFLAIGD